MVETSNLQKPFLIFDSRDSEKGSWYENFQKFRFFFYDSFFLLSGISREYTNAVNSRIQAS